MRERQFLWGRPAYGGKTCSGWNIKDGISNVPDRLWIHTSLPDLGTNLASCLRLCGQKAEAKINRSGAMHVGSCSSPMASLGDLNPCCLSVCVCRYFASSGVKSARALRGFRLKPSETILLLVFHIKELHLSSICARACLSTRDAAGACKCVLCGIV